MTPAIAARQRRNTRAIVCLLASVVAGRTACVRSVSHRQLRAGMRLQLREHASLSGAMFGSEAAAVNYPNG
jgi:hypothetical protein